ncbi:ankyrin repeat-containing domain protein [Aspergillus heterothallicus]
MHLFDLPLEIFHAILAQTLPTKYNWRQLPMHRGDLTEIQLVNTLAPDAYVYYATRTVRQSTDWIVAQLSAQDRRQEICRALSHSAACRYRSLKNNMVGAALKPTYSGAEYRTGLGQSSDAPAHRLSAAACIGDLALIQLLLDQGVDVNGRSDIFETALVNAARWGHLSLVQFLLANGADLHRDVIHEVGGWVDDDIKDLVGWFQQQPEFSHALQAAAFGGHEHIISLLLEPRWKLSRSSCTYFNAVISSAAGGSAHVLWMLLAGAEPYAIQQPLKKMVLDQALKKAAVAGHIECIEFLINIGTSLSYNLDAAPQNTALYYAAQGGHCKAIELLLDGGANIDESLWAYDHPLPGAGAAGHPRAVSLLLDRGAGFESNGDVLGWQLSRVTLKACILRIIFDRGYHKQCPGSASRGLRAAMRKNRPDLVAVFHEYGITPAEEQKCRRRRPRVQNTASEPRIC